jgi:hypothetical protein
MLAAKGGIRRERLPLYLAECMESNEDHKVAALPFVKVRDYWYFFNLEGNQYINHNVKTECTNLRSSIESFLKFFESKFMIAYVYGNQVLTRLGIGNIYSSASDLLGVKAFGIPPRDPKDVIAEYELSNSYIKFFGG